MTSPLRSPLPIIGVPQRPMTRSTDGAVLGGVCAGLAVRLGVREQMVRIVVSLSVLFFGAGLLIYMAAWLSVPRWGEDLSVAQRLIGARRESHIILLTLLFALIALLALGDFAKHWTGATSWPVLLGLVAVVAVWFGASREEKSHLQDVVNASV